MPVCFLSVSCLELLHDLIFDSQAAASCYLECIFLPNAYSWRYFCILQDNEPLMRALSKLIYVNSPDLILFVGEALVGNDAVDQLSKFNQVDSLFLFICPQ